MIEELVAPCGMNCNLCIGYFGYTMTGDKRKKPCAGCRTSEKICAFLKKQCNTLSNNSIKYCFECKVFPCENLKKIDKKYRTKYNTSLIENLKFIKDNGINKFLEKQKEKFLCPKCNGYICMHDNKCYNCKG